MTLSKERVAADLATIDSGCNADCKLLMETCLALFDEVERLRKALEMVRRVRMLDNLSATELAFVDAALHEGIPEEKG